MTPQKARPVPDKLHSHQRASGEYEATCACPLRPYSVVRLCLSCTSTPSVALCVPAYVAERRYLGSYKANPASVVTTVVDEETGEEKKRLINRSRWKGFGPIAINFSDKGVPDKPSETIEKQRPHADKTLLRRLQEVCASHVPSATSLHSDVFLTNPLLALPAVRRTSYLDACCVVESVQRSRGSRDSEVGPIFSDVQTV